MRLARDVNLTAAERQALSAMEGPDRGCPRGAVLRRERDGTGPLWVLVSGWVASCLHLPDGGRQITTVHLPGELLGAAGIAGGAGETLLAITDAVVRPIGRAALASLFDSHPRTAALLFQFAQIDRLALGDRMAAIGRTPARARIAALLLDLRDRLHAADPAIGDTLPLPMTQEEIGDATGLTAVHVNRMMRTLAEDGLIERTGGSVRLIQPDRLRRMSGHVSRTAALDTGWLPAARH